MGFYGPGPYKQAPGDGTEATTKRHSNPSLPLQPMRGWNVWEMSGNSTVLYCRLYREQCWHYLHPCSLQLFFFAPTVPQGWTVPTSSTQRKGCWGEPWDSQQIRCCLLSCFSWSIVHLKILRCSFWLLAALHIVPFLFFAEMFTHCGTVLLFPAADKH